MTRKAKSKQVTDPYLQREQLKYEHPIPSREFILDTLRERGRPISRRELADLLALEDPEQLEGLRRRLRAMQRDGQLIQNRRRHYMIVDNKELLPGRVMGQADGSGILIADEGTQRLYLPPREMRTLMHGDRAVVRVTGFDHQGRPEAALVEVLKRQNTRIVGRFYRESGVCFVVPDNKRITHDVIVPAEQSGGAEHGDR